MFRVAAVLKRLVVFVFVFLSAAARSRDSSSSRRRSCRSTNLSSPKLSPMPSSNQAFRQVGIARDEQLKSAFVWIFLCVTRSFVIYSAEVVELAMDKVSVLFGVEILKLIAGMCGHVHVAS